MICYLSNEDRSLEKRLQVGWQFDEEITRKLLDASEKLPKGYLHLSQKAMRLITEELQSEQPDDAPLSLYDKACLAAG